MIDFELSEEQRAMQTLAREFAEKEIKPIAAERDRLPAAECFPMDMVPKLSKIGFRTLSLDKKYGGSGLDSLTIAIILEELAVGDIGISEIVALSGGKFVQDIQWHGTEEQCQNFLVPFAKDENFLIATSASEADLSSDRLSGYRGPIGLKTTAVLDGDEWVINGTKQWCSGGLVAKLLRVVVMTDEGQATILVPKDTPGVTVGRVHEKLGDRLLPTCEMIYENVRVPKENMIGKPRKTVEPTRRYARASNAYAAACALGVGRAAYETALEYGKTRIQGGRRIIEHQAIGGMLADMYAHLQAGRLFYMKAAWQADREEYYDPKCHAMAKVFCCEVAADVARKALEIHGGYGATKDFPLEKYVRDTVTLLHSDGTSQALTDRAAVCLAEGW